VVISLALLTGLYLFVTYEETAITTIPRQEIEVFVPADASPDATPPSNETPVPEATPSS
jgi:hypothetical protein